MITKFAYIKAFGSFINFDWDSTVRDTANNIVIFGKLNIVYGRNYSGKTTLSRIMRSYKTKQLHEDYPDARYKVCDSERGDLCECDISTSTLEVRVYNTDFVNDNLKFLRDKSGNIQPFAVMGEKNIDTEENIKKIQDEIGDESSGLIKIMNDNAVKLKEKQRELANTEKKLDGQLQEKARVIKLDTAKFNVPIYNKTKLLADINKVISKPCLLAPEVRKEKERIINEAAKVAIGNINIVEPQHDILFANTISALNKEIKPSKSIKELLGSPELQQWVRDGIKLHKNEKTTCAFCGNIIPSDLWDRLDAHFSKESEELRNTISKLIWQIDDELDAFKDLQELPESSFYIELKDAYKEVYTLANEHIKAYRTVLNAMKSSLATRMNNIFKCISVELPAIETNEFILSQKAVNNVIYQNNELTKGISDKQNSARVELLLHEVKEFIDTIKYEAEVSKIKFLENEEQKLISIVKNHKSEIDKRQEHIKALKSELSDERKGAEQVNNYLKHFFGHNSLSLESKNDASGSKFVLMRGDKQAYNLSEGECSLVAFCYFMAKLNDLGTNAQNTTIWIDDPVSSLDSNHIFFVFSLIKNVLTQPKNYHQLFISTHNLDFLKYLKRVKKKDEEAKYFVLENDGCCSRLRLMPKHLKKYITEFNYLFGIIYKCAQDSTSQEDFDYYYNFGNNLRKFLEAFLFFKYPNRDDIENKLRKFFGCDNISTSVVTRVDNEFSHLEEIFDRSITPIDVPEMKKIAQYVLNKIEEVDKDQFDALVVSIQ